MPIPDFGYGGNTSQQTDVSPTSNEESKVDINSGKETKVDTNGNPIEDITSQHGNDDGNKQDDNKNNNIDPGSEDKHDDNKIELKEGSTIELDNNKYTVDKDGNIVDESGNIFKKADEVQEWLKSFEVSEEQPGKELTVDNIIKSVDVEITDEEGKPIQYENSPEGIKAYIDDVIETGKEEVAEATINAFYSQYPFVKPMVDYFIANGNSLDGWNEIPDRSNITLDDKNEAQQESIIRTAWKEDDRRGNVDSYIAYLKSQGTLAETAREELEALIEKDKANKAQLEKDAEKAQQKAIADSKAYWDNVKKVIDNKKVAGYQIPDTIIVERNGKKVSVTSNDFFNYLYRTDKNGITDYVKDLQKQSADHVLEDEILRAYLLFTGGNYSDLVKMAITEEKVKNLKLSANKRRGASTIKITPPTNNQNDNNNKESFGY